MMYIHRIKNIKHERLDSSWILCTLSLAKEKYMSFSRPIVCFLQKLMQFYCILGCNPTLIPLYKYLYADIESEKSKILR